VSGNTEPAAARPRRPKRAPSVAVTFLPATYVTMTPEQEEKAVAALAGLLIEADEHRPLGPRPAP
jgi:hypothetical protein